MANITTVIVDTDWKGGMLVMLLACFFLIAFVGIGLFGPDCKGGICWLWLKWIGFWCYVKCCKCQRNYTKIVQEKGHVLQEFTIGDEEEEEKEEEE